MGSRYNLQLLGTVQVSRGVESVTGFRSRKALALLAYLAVQHQPIPRDHLVALFWECQPEERGRANLSWVLNKISTLLPGCLRADRHSVEFVRAPAYDLDVDLFDSLVAQGDAPALASAVELYRGDLLAGMVLDGCAEFEIWLEGERERWRQRMMRALDTLVAHHSRPGEHGRALHFARRLLAFEPWQESTHRQVMHLLARCGQRNAALIQYESCRRILAQELGVEPARETTALYERIRAGVPAHRSSLPPQPTPFVGRKAELAQVAALLQNPDCRLLTILGPGGIGKTRLALEAAAGAEAFLEGVCFVPLAPVSSAEFLASALAEAVGIGFFEQQGPLAQLLNHLRGRQMLLILDGFEHLLAGSELLVQLLQAAPEVKLLVTSRECLRLRWEWRFEIGGLECPLAGHDGVPDPAEYSSLQLFLQTARRMQPSFSLSGRIAAPAARICRLVEGMPLAIELAASWVAARTCEEIAQEIERSLGFLSTGMHDVPERQRSLQATFEHSWHLLTPSEQFVLAGLSVFRGGFGTRAAEEVSGASPADLRSLLGKSLLRYVPTDRYDLHELLRQFAAQKLAARPEEHAATCERHSAFVMGFLQQQEERLVGVEAGEAAAAIKAEIENVRTAWRWAVTYCKLEEIERGLCGLSRFYLLAGPFDEGEALIQMAADRIRTLSGEGNGAEAGNTLCRLLGERARFLNRLGMHDQAIVVAQEAVDVTPRDASVQAAGVQAVSHLQWGEALLRRAELGAAQSQLERARMLAQAARSRHVEAECLGNLAGTYAQQGDGERARDLCEQALQMSRELGDPWGESRALNNLGIVARRQGDYSTAQAHYEQALRIKRAIGHRHGEAIALGNLGIVLRCQGDYGAAKAHYEQALQIHRKVGNRQGEGDVLNNLGGVCIQQDDYTGANAYREQALRLHREVGDRQGESRALGNLGAGYSCQGDHSRALACLEQALSIYREIGDRRGEMQILEDLGLAFTLQGAYARAKTCHEQALCMSREMSDEKEQAGALSRLALCLHFSGDDQGARELSRQALGIARTIGNRSLEAEALTYLGHAANGLGQPGEAAAAYGDALALRQDLGERNRAMECLAGLARVLLARGAHDEARARVEEILGHLRTGTLEGTVDPFRISLTCYRVLRANQDPRALSILAAAYRLLQEQAARIQDEGLRRLFLQGVPAHRDLAQEARTAGI